MKETRDMMGMPITVEIVDASATSKDIDNIFEYFSYINNTFSTYKESSEITQINKGMLHSSDYSNDMQIVFQLAEQTKKETNGYFDIFYNGTLDPSGLVKGWAIWNASKLLKEAQFQNYYIEAGGDIQVSGKNSENKKWTIGIRNPFNQNEIVKVLQIDNMGVATSGTYLRGNHIYNPHDLKKMTSNIVSLTVIGPNVYEADRFATAAFAMEEKGIEFIEKLRGFEGYMIDKSGLATFTTGFSQYQKE